MDQSRLPESASAGPTERQTGSSAQKQLETRPLKKNILTWWIGRTKVEARRSVEDEVIFHFFGVIRLRMGARDNCLGKPRGEFNVTVGTR